MVPDRRMIPTGSLLKPAGQAQENWLQVLKIFLKRAKIYVYAFDFMIAQDRNRIVGEDEEVDTARTPIRDLLMYGLRHSPILRTQVPKVRRLALIETLQSITAEEDTQIDKDALFIILENVQTSPYLTKEQFQNAIQEVLQYVMQRSYFLTSETVDAMKERITSEDWEGLLAVTAASEDDFQEENDYLDPLLLSRSSPLSRDSTRIGSKFPIKLTKAQKLRSFRDMSVSIFSSSRRIASMDITRRRTLSRKIHSAFSIDAITKVAMHYLDTSSIITDNSLRQGIKDLRQRGRFDLLLLPDNFDCEELPRLYRRSDGDHDEEEGEEDDTENRDCVICLDNIDELQMTLLSCNHSFCTECIHIWMEHSPTCPTCRHQIGHQQNARVTHSNTHIREREQTGWNGHPIHNTRDSLRDVRRSLEQELETTLEMLEELGTGARPDP